MTTNPFYTRSDTLQPHIRARAEAVNDEFSRIQAGFDQIPAYLDVAAAAANFYPTRAEAVAALPVGGSFTSDETGEMRAYRVTDTAPFYVDLGDQAVPLSKQVMAGNSGLAKIGTPEGTAEQLIYGESVQPLFRGLIKPFARTRAKAREMAEDLSGMVGYAQYANTLGANGGPVYEVWNASDSAREEGSFAWACGKVNQTGGTVLIMPKGNMVIPIRQQILIEADDFTIDAPGRNVTLYAPNNVQMLKVRGKNGIIRRIGLGRYPGKTIADNENIIYTATSGQTAFTIPFQYTATADIVVVKNDYIRLIEGTDYTVSAPGDTGTVTLTAGATAGDKVQVRGDFYNQGAIWIDPTAADRIWLDQLTLTDHQTYAVDVQSSALVPGMSPCRVTMSRCAMRNQYAGMSVGSGALAQQVPPAWATTALAQERLILMTSYHNFFDCVGRRSQNCNALAFIDKVGDVHVVEGYRADARDSLGRLIESITAPYATQVLNGGMVLSRGDYVRPGGPLSDDTRGMFARQGAWVEAERQGPGALKIVDSVFDGGLTGEPYNAELVPNPPYTIDVPSVPTTDADKLAYLFERMGETGAETAPLSEMTYAFVPKTEGDAAGLYPDGFNVVLARNGYRQRTRQVSAVAGGNNSAAIITSSLTIERGRIQKINSGALYLAENARFAIDTEGGGSTDDLVNIIGGDDGDIITFWIVSASRTVTLKTTGNLAIGSDYTITSPNSPIVMQYDGTAGKWKWINQVPTDTTAAQMAAVLATQGFLNVLNTNATALPYEVRAITGGIGTGTGGTPGEYALAATGGPAGFQAFVTIGSDGRVAGYRITNPGLSTSNTAPTLSLAGVTGLTGATTPTATVAAVQASRVFLAPSADGEQFLAWINNAGALSQFPLAPATQFSQYAKGTIDAIVADMNATASDFETTATGIVASLSSTTYTHYGRPAGETLLTTGTNVTTQPIFLLDAITEAGTLDTVDVGDKAAGTITIGQYRAGARIATATITLTGAGASSKTPSVPLDFAIGDVIALCLSASGLITRATAKDGAGVFVGAGSSLPATVTLGASSNIRPEIRFNIKTVKQSVTAAALQALADTDATQAATLAEHETAIDQLRGPVVGVIGRPAGVTLANGAAGITTSQLYFKDAVKGASTGFTVSLYARLASGTAEVAVYRAGSLVATFTLTVTALGNQDFTISQEIEKNDIIALRAITSGLFGYGSPGQDGAGIYVGSSGSFPSTVTIGAATTIYPQVRISYTYDGQVVTADALEGISTNYAPRNCPPSSNLPISTDKRGMRGLWVKTASILRTGTGKASIIVTGDSYAEYVAIPQQLATQLYAVYGTGGEGFMSVGALTSANGRAMNGVQMSQSGWTKYDASDGGAVPATGCGPDGQSIYTSGTTATIGIANLTANTVKAFYSKAAAGKFRYRVDGGSYTTVTSDGSGGVGVLTISGLSAGLHTVDIDTSVNDGTIAFHGFYSERTAAGVIVSKVGNAAAAGRHISLFASTSIAPVMAQIQTPDAVVVLLGTNDYKDASSTVTTFLAGLSALVSGYRSVNPNCAFVFVAPPDTNGSAILPLTDYRDALYTFCLENGHEFRNVHDEWADWATENAAGMFADAYHVTDNGAFRLARSISAMLIQ